jgi:hypothetical protein
MNPRRSPLSRKRDGWMNVDLLVAIALLLLVVLPLAYGMVGERRLLDAELRRAALVELLDGELEILLAGEWRNRPEGESDVPLTGAATARLQPGRCVLVKTGKNLRLEWRSEKRDGAVSVSKEAVAR